MLLGFRFFSQYKQFIDDSISSDTSAFLETYSTVQGYIYSLSQKPVPGNIPTSLQDIFVVLWIYIPKMPTEAHEVNIIIIACETGLSANNISTATRATLMTAAIRLSFCQQLLVEHLLCTQCSRHWDTAVNKIFKASDLMRMISLGGTSMCQVSVLDYSMSSPHLYGVLL